MIILQPPEPFDAAAAAERRALRLALFILKNDARLEYEAGGPARLITRVRGADQVLASVSEACARDAQTILHGFDPEEYAAPPGELAAAA